MDALSQVPTPRNEPVRMYEPGSADAEELHTRLAELNDQPPVVLPQVIAGVEVMGGGSATAVVQPHRHAAVLGTLRNATAEDVAGAVEAALAAGPQWRALSFAERAGVFLRAADLLAGPWRATLNAATMLGQSKSCYQAEIDAACELIDFLRFNVAFAEQLQGIQPASSPGVWNRLDYRPLEGFVTAITPFNFTAIAGNLPTAPAILGNTVVWKPATTQQFAAHFIMKLLAAAGLPPGVINMVTGDGRAVSEVALLHRDLSGIHFTGSTGTFRHLWGTVANNLDRYRDYPRVVGETGGKDFVIAHPSADPDALVTALVRGAFEYQGQKCSAASRAYIPDSIWRQIREPLVATVDELSYGDITDFAHFGGAVIDDRSFARLSKVLDDVAADPQCEIVAGGTADDSVGYFVQPTVVTTTDPRHRILREEFFGPILSVFVFPDEHFDAVVDEASVVADYALTGAIFATDRVVISKLMQTLRYAAGNFYINDKPTGAVVGQQPFGGARASGTNDKAGSILNVLRWVSPRAIKETFVPPSDYRYPHMD